MKVKPVCVSKKPIGIIGAMAVEVEALIAGMEGVCVEEAAGLAFHRGTLEGVPCVVAECGPGKVNAAVCAQTMLLRYEPRLIINVGVAGGVGSQVHIGDLVVAAACVQYDFDTTAMGDPLGTVFIRRASGDNEDVRLLPCCEEAAAVLLEEARSIYGGAHFGVVCTGDTFVADPEKNRFLDEAFQAQAVEMEGGAIAQVCYMGQVPCAVLRAISDCANDESPMDFPAFTKVAAEKSSQLLKAAIGRL